MSTDATTKEQPRTDVDLCRRRLRRDGLELSYQVAGEGPVVLLIPGFGCSGSSWIPWLRDVQPQGFRALLLDNRGTGASTGSSRLYDMGAMADDAAAVLQREAQGRPSVIVGHSMGGMVAQHVTLRHPHLVGGLVLSASAPQRPTFDLAALRSLPISLLAMVSRSVKVWSLCDRTLLHPHKSSEQAHRMLQPLRRIQREEPYSRLNSWMQLNAIARHATLPQLSALSVPVEVIVGAGDRVLQPANSRLLAQHIPGASLTVLEDVGHEIPVEAPQALLRSLSRLLERTERSGSDPTPN